MGKPTKTAIALGRRMNIVDQLMLSGQHPFVAMSAGLERDDWMLVYVAMRKLVTDAHQPDGLGGIRLSLAFELQDTCGGGKRKQLFLSRQEYRGMALAEADGSYDLDGLIRSLQILREQFSEQENAK